MEKSKKFVLYTFNLLLIFSFVFLSSDSTVLADVSFSWVKSMGGVAYDSVTSINFDAQGNMYITGSFQDTIDLDPGAGVYNLTPNGSLDVFVSKLDPSGNFLWGKSIGGTGVDYAWTVNVHSSGVYVSGRFSDTVDFDPGVGTYNLTSNGGYDIYVLKLDQNGDFIWAKSVGGTVWDSPKDALIDSSGNIYLTGRLDGDTIDFDPGPGVFNLPSAGAHDFYVLKLDQNGDFGFAKRLAGASTDIALSIALDNSGNIYTTGYFSGTADFDPGVGTYNLTSNGSEDIFISKLDTNGDFVWAKHTGGLLEDDGHAIHIDSLNNIYLTGYFQGTTDLDPGAGTHNLTALGPKDIFVLKLDSSGDFVWGKALSGTGTDTGEFISTDSLGNVYTLGNFQNTIDFDPGAGVYNLAGGGAFISKLNSNGDFVWAKKIGASVSRGLPYNVINSNSIFIVGSFTSTVDFDPGAGVYNLTSAGSGDAFILKLSQAPLISEVTPVGVIVNNNPISYTFTTDEPGTITYGGSCSSATTVATAGSNTITLNTLSPGNYSNCTITVTDGLNNVSNVLTISPFDIVVHSGGGSSTPTTSTTITESTINNTVTPPVLENTTTEVTTTVLPPTNTYTSPIDGTTKSCPAFTKYLRVGSRLNDKQEARLWQAFLNTKEEEKLKIDGIYGKQTESAIKRFQNKYKDFILSPWNLISPTGYTYQSTRAYANKLINCSEGSVTLDNGKVINY